MEEEENDEEDGEDDETNDECRDECRGIIRLLACVLADIFDGGRGLRAWALYQATAARNARCEGRPEGGRV